MSVVRKTDMGTLSDFLLARIAEDEAGIRAAASRPIGNTNVTWDPARVLAECEAKRRIVEEHSAREVASLDRETWGQAFNVCRRCREGEVRQIVAPCPTLRLLALPYADHEDYREEWKP